MSCMIIAQDVNAVTLESGGQPVQVCCQMPFLSDGQYSVTVNVTDSSGTVTYTEEITLTIGVPVVEPPPVPVLKADPSGPRVS